MPIYEYRCSSCGTELEKLQKISDPPMVECPECGKPALVKLVSASSFRLKGSGWYETDFKTGNKKNGAAGSDAEANAGSSKGADGDKSGASDSPGNAAKESAKSGDKPAADTAGKAPGASGTPANSTGSGSNSANIGAKGTGPATGSGKRPSD